MEYFLFVRSSDHQLKVDGVCKVHQLIRLVSDVEGHMAKLARIGAVEGGGCRETVVDQAAWGISRDNQGGNHVGPPVWRETGLGEVGGAEV